MFDHDTPREEVRHLLKVHSRNMSWLERQTGFAAKVIGDSCFPALVQGDLTIWHSEPNPPYGRIVIAQRKGDHGCTVKELHYDQAVLRPVLRPINPQYSAPPDGDGWGVIAFLVGLIREDSEGIEESYYNKRGFTPRQLLRISSKFLDN